MPMSDLHCRFQPRLRLQTLTRGDGVLGLRPAGLFGPRGGNVTVASVDWTYQAPHGPGWETPAPTTRMAPPPSATQTVVADDGQSWRIQRDLAAEAAALDAICRHGLRALHKDAIQWRGAALADLPASLWSLVQEEHFGDFWADSVPLLQQQGWRIVVAPGFAHDSVSVDAWRLIVSPLSGEVTGKEPATALAPQAVRQLAGLGGLRAAGRAVGWLVTLGVEIDGEDCDLLPLLTDLMRRDGRWLDLQKIAQIDDKALISLRLPGGRRVNAPAATLKPIMSAMLDLLTDPRRQQGPLRDLGCVAPRCTRSTIGGVRIPGRLALSARYRFARVGAALACRRQPTTSCPAAGAGNTTACLPVAWPGLVAILASTRSGRDTCR